MKCVQDNKKLRPSSATGLWMNSVVNCSQLATFSLSEFRHGSVGCVGVGRAVTSAIGRFRFCRPQDSGFFGDALRCVILDEAHLYSGALAGEITLLLRRLLDRCGVASSQVLHLATSATMGGNDDQLKEFAATLFSKSKDLMKVIRGVPTRTIAGLPSVCPNILRWRRAIVGPFGGFDQATRRFTWFRHSSRWTNSRTRRPTVGNNVPPSRR